MEEIDPSNTIAQARVILRSSDLGLFEQADYTYTLVYNIQVGLVRQRLADILKIGNGNKSDDKSIEDNTRLQDSIWGPLRKCEARNGLLAGSNRQSRAQSSQRYTLYTPNCVSNEASVLRRPMTFKATLTQYLLLGP